MSFCCKVSQTTEQSLSGGQISKLKCVWNLISKPVYSQRLFYWCILALICSYFLNNFVFVVFIYSNAFIVFCNCEALRKSDFEKCHINKFFLAHFLRTTQRKLMVMIKQKLMKANTLTYMQTHWGGWWTHLMLPLKPWSLANDNTHTYTHTHTHTHTHTGTGGSQWNEQDNCWLLELWIHCLCANTHCCCILKIWLCACVQGKVGLWDKILTQEMRWQRVRDGGLINLTDRKRKERK